MAPFLFLAVTKIYPAKFIIALLYIKIGGLTMVIEPLKRRVGVYKYVITEDVVYKSTKIKKTFENNWLRIENTGDITIKGSYGEGYAWDGCSPKINIFDLFLFGTPDGRTNVNTGKSATYYASLIHDILRQYRKEIGITRKETDQVFLDYLGDFDLRYIYYLNVRVFGFFYRFFRD